MTTVYLVTINSSIGPIFSTQQKAIDFLDDECEKRGLDCRAAMSSNNEEILDEATLESAKHSINIVPVVVDAEDTVLNR
jgi:hypothetical protein